jgi:membrane protein YqaA with SNARE-associated domain
MIAILGIVSTVLSTASSVLSVAKIFKDWHKPAGYLIRFINFIGGIVDWVIAKFEQVDQWLNGKKAKVDDKIVKKKIEKKHRRKYGRWKARRKKF